MSSSLKRSMVDTLDSYDIQKLEDFEYDDGCKVNYQVDKTIAGVSVIAIGDPHFRVDNLEDVTIFIHKMEQFIKTERPDFVVVLGDLLHTHERIHTSVMNKAYTFVNKLRMLCPTYILVGNHDYINNSQFLSDKHWMNAMKEWDNVFIVDKGMVSTTPFGKFIFCPYVFPGHFRKALDMIDPEWRTARTIFCHQEFFGCKMGAIISSEGDKWDEQYPFIVSGHIHDTQRLQQNIVYTGSAMQHAFGESHDKTITLCEFSNNIKVKKVDLNLPKKRILYMDISELKNYVVRHTKDKIRITLSGSYEEFKVFSKSKKFKELVKNNIKVVYKNRDIQTTHHTTKVNENFYENLWRLVEEEGNEYMKTLYKEIVQP